MALPMNHIALRAQKSLALFQGAPVYENLPSFSAPESSARTSQYDPTGRYFAYATLTTVVVADAQTGAVVRELAVAGAVELSFSAKGTYLSSWERYSKPADENAQHQNLRVFSVESGEEVMGFTQKGQENWQPSFTPSESHLIRHNSNSSEILLFPTPLSPSTQPSSRLKVEGLKSIWAGGGTEGEGLAVFVGEKNGAPAQLSLYSMQTLRGATPVPTARKNFFKADKISVRWNKAGTMVLFLTQTDVDKTNQNYYGETNLYLLALRGGFECRVALDKEGPIHDYGWNPNSREFGVVYGYMPAKAVLFDTKANPAHDLGLSPRNYINFQPQGRFFLLAGFGNLSGTIDVWDRKSMKKVAQISAPNASACEWSPCGSFIMTATLSPRLRVDNGFKIWYVGGQLLASEAINDLYQALWRPMPSAPDFPAAIPPCPAFSASVSSLPPPPPKPVAAGAYRPPGARAAGTSTPSIFLREDQGGAPSSGPPGAPAYAANGGKANGGRRNVPGYVPKEDGAQAPKKGKKGKKDGRNGQGDSQPQTPTTELAPPLAHFPAVPAAAAPAAEVADVDPIAKKVRNLSKKLKAIDDLKEKLAKGEKLEATQVLKIKSEGAIRLELAALEK